MDMHRLHPRWRLTGIALVALIGFLCLAPAASAEQPQPSEESEIPVELIQAALRFMGHYTGPLDGRIDRDTRVAFGLWQQSAGLEVTGQLTLDQQLALIRDSAAAGFTKTLAEPAPPPAELGTSEPTGTPAGAKGDRRTGSQPG